ncbi:hypothetical protein EV714DRAFT_285698 [Schizophyllum commune]
MVYGVRSRKFCCCLPVRFGVFVMTLFGVCGGGAVAGVTWYMLAHKDTHYAAKVDHTELIVGAAIYTLLTLVCIFGLAGCLFRIRALVRTYLFMLAAHFLISVGTGVWILFEFFCDGKQKWIDKCVDQANGDKDAEDICKDAYGAARWTVLAIFVVAWLIELYGVIIVDNYVDQLTEERRARDSRYTNVPLDEAKVSLVHGRA